MARGKSDPNKATGKGNGMLSIPRLDRAPTSYLVDALGGVEIAAQRTKTSVELIRLWTTGELDTPFTAKLALYWVGPFGFDQAFSESHWAHSYNTFLKHEARERVAKLEAFITAHGLPLPPGRITTPAETLIEGPHSNTSHELRRLAEKAAQRDQKRLT